ncbi:excinuclease ABC subunit UvrC [Candidatus Peregrinibacteria bacterium]|nr:excinuclease ABC subunit UvrC [Candidatus Peregrinibacteria bacterium]
MKNIKGDIIYVGKAIDLFKRVGSYFKNIHKHPPRTAKMVEQISDIEYTVVTSDLEALMLETNLIKELRPKYNILMKDDKNFAYIKITTNEDYPRILVTRKVLRDKAKYFGPKSAASKIYDTLNLLRKIFPYRNCHLEITDLGESDHSDPSIQRKVKVSKAGIKYPCLDLHIKRCVAPCIGRPSQEEYQRIIDRIIDFLEGRYQNVVNQLKEDMQIAAQQKKFEQAAKIRDKILSIENIYQTQLVTSPDHQNADIINYYTEDDLVYFNIFQIREGKLIDQQNVTIKKPDLDSSEAQILTSFLQQFYSANTNLPKEIFIPISTEQDSTLESWITDLAGHKVKINIPQKGKNDKLMALALENAHSFAKQSRARWEGESKATREEALEELSQLLGLGKPPKRMECYDISHLSGTNTVASMSVFENGFPKKQDYRHFKINLENPGSPDDFASMEEVILRRLKYLKPSIGNQGLKISKTKLGYQVKKDQEIILTFKTLSESKLKTFLTEYQHPQEHFEPVIKKICEKFDTKRIYLQIPTKFLREYEKIGFQQVKVDSQEYPVKSGKTVIVYDCSRNYEDPSFKKTPDLIVIDGGKGQLSHAVKAMQDHHISIPIISIAKKQEEFFLPGQNHSIQLESNNVTRLMIQHLRDEAHRFAIEYNRKLRQKDYTSSELENIAGIGKKLTQKLFRQFGSVENLRNQSEEEIAKIVGLKLAQKIKNFLQ